MSFTKVLSSSSIIFTIALPLLLNLSCISPKSLRRDWETKQLFTRADLQFYKHAIFPTVRQCEKREDILIVQVKVSELTGDPYKGPSLSTWSTFLSDFVFYNEKELESDPEYKSLIKKFYDDPHYHVIRFGVLVLFGLMTLFTMFGFFFIPICGLIGFRFSYLIVRLFSSRPIKKFGRYIIIRRELWRRKRERYLIPILVNKKVPKRFYRVPHFFREETDEDEPEILKNFQGTIAIQIKESSSEVSVDKLYKEFYKNGEPIVKNVPHTGIYLTPEQEARLGTDAHASRLHLTQNREEKKKLKKEAKKKLKRNSIAPGSNYEDNINDDEGDKKKNQKKKHLKKQKKDGNEYKPRDSESKRENRPRDSESNRPRDSESKKEKRPRDSESKKENRPRDSENRSRRVSFS